MLLFFEVLLLWTHFSNNFGDSNKLVVSTSCSLLHTAVDLDNEPKLDTEIKSWLAFAAQVVEVNALAKALTGQKDEVYISFIVLRNINPDGV